MLTRIGMKSEIRLVIGGMETKVVKMNKMNLASKVKTNRMKLKKVKLNRMRALRKAKLNKMKVLKML